MGTFQQGPNTAGNGTDGGGPHPWLNAEYVASNVNYASLVSPSNVLSNWLVAQDFEFAIPAAATILGISVSFTAYALPGNVGRISEITLWSAGNPFGSSKPDAAPTNTPTTFAYGGTSDLWGGTLTPALVNAPGFGAAIQVTSTNTASLSVNNFQMTVSYVLPDSVGLDAGTNLVGQVEVSDGTNVLLTSAHPGYVQGSFSISNFPSSVAVSNFPAVQAVSIASSPPLPVSIALSPPLPVTGTFWQATQPVSILTMPSTPVTGTFFQATQPVSGSVSVGNFPATQPVSLTSTTITGSVAVTGSFFQATQPVSLTSTTVTGSVAVTGTFYPYSLGQQLAAASVPVVLTAAQLITLTPPAVFGGVVTQATGTNLHVVVDTAPTTAVTGTFFQATQPVSLASTTIAGSVAVTGTFFQATQPVSGAFFQTTQPVSLASTTITGSVAVTGTFYPYSLGQQLAAASVPVVLTAAQITTLTPPAAIANFANETGGNLAAIKADTDKIPSLGQALAAASVPVVLTAAQITALTPPSVFGGVVTNAGTFATQATLAAETTKIIGTVNVAASQTIAVTQATPANLQVTATPIALTKATQGATGFSVQSLKDAGRTLITLTVQALAGIASETLISTFNLNKGGTVTGSTGSYTITNGKTLRIQNISYSVRAGAAAVPFSRITLRSNTAGATVATSPVVWAGPEVFGISAVSGVGGQESVDFPDGLEIAGNGTISIGVSHLDQATTNVINISVVGYEY